MNIGLKGIELLTLCQRQVHPEGVGQLENDQKEKFSEENQNQVPRCEFAERWREMAGFIIRNEIQTVKSWKQFKNHKAITKPRGTLNFEAESPSST